MNKKDVKQNGEESAPIDLDKQRKNRARVFKLKKWIMNIEQQPNKSAEMQNRLNQYYDELADIQSSRGAFTEETARSLIQNNKRRLRGY